MSILPIAIVRCEEVIEPMRNLISDSLGTSHKDSLCNINIPCLELGTVGNSPLITWLQMSRKALVVTLQWFLFNQQLFVTYINTSFVLGTTFLLY